MTKIRTNTEITISCQELDRVVRETYGRPYCFQQQDGCKSRGTQYVEVPSDGYDFENDTIPEVVNGEEMGVSFDAWLARDPKQKLSPKEGEDYYGYTDGSAHSLELWWTRNFYPSLDMVLDDLHKKGIIDAGEYTIVIDW